MLKSQAQMYDKLQSGSTAAATINTTGPGLRYDDVFRVCLFFGSCVPDCSCVFMLLLRLLSWSPRCFCNCHAMQASGRLDIPFHAFLSSVHSFTPQPLYLRGKNSSGYWVGDSMHPQFKVAFTGKDFDYETSCLTKFRFQPCTWILVNC